MPVNMLMRLQVDDFDAWLAPPDVVAENFRAGGALAYTLSRSTDDENLLTVVVEFPDEESARTFAEMYRKAAAARNENGPRQEIVEISIGRVVESHSRRLT